MRTVRNTICKHQTAFAFALLFLLGAALRLWRFTQFPVGLNQDEAYAGYEAFSLLTTGADSHGYPYPVYFVSWGSGMNALYSYLTIPFVALLGLNVLAIRLPQVIFGLLSIPLAYGIGHELPEKKALPMILAGVVALDPWHIMISRFGLEANLLIFFLLLGLYLLLLGLRKPQALLGAGMAFGLSLYCYAPVWVILPFFLLLTFALLLYTKKLRVTPWLVGGVAVLAVSAVPLILFLLVNYGLIDEIVTPWISVPRLLIMRHNFSFEHFGEKLRLFAQLIFVQKESLNTACSDAWVGLHHHFATPLWLVGGFFLFRDLIKTLRDKRFRPQVLILLLALCAIPSSLMIDKLLIGRVVHSNTLQICLVLMTGYGILSLRYLFIKHGVNWQRALSLVLALAWLGGTALFTYSYFERTPKGWSYGYEEALNAAVNDPQQREIYIRGGISWPNMLVALQMPPEEFRAKVTWAYYPAEFLEISSIGRIHPQIDMEALTPKAIYMIEADNSYLIDVFNSIQFTRENHGHYDLWYVNDTETWYAEHPWVKRDE